MFSYTIIAVVIITLRSKFYCAIGYVFHQVKPNLYCSRL